jgi:hypothetical protein
LTTAAKEKPRAKRHRLSGRDAGRTVNLNVQIKPEVRNRLNAVAALRGLLNEELIEDLVDRECDRLGIPMTASA